MKRTTACFLLLVLGGAGWASAAEVVVYTAHDEVYSRPILERFEDLSGIRTRAAHDTEASKTTGLVQRLIAEKEHPRADVFWNNEVAQSIVLKTKGVLAPYVSPQATGIPAPFKDPQGYWTGFAARGRVIIYNTDLLTDPPRSILDFTQERWRGKAGVALPLFGTTATHVAALFAHLGEDKAKALLLAMRDNGVTFEAGNATVRDRVAKGELHAGLTDTDDANGAVLDGRPAKWLFPDQGKDQMGTLVIPNSVCLIKGCPNPEAGKKLIDFLLSEEVELTLAASRSLQIPLRKGLHAPEAVPKLAQIKAMPVSFAEVADQMPAAAAFSLEAFVR